MARIIVTSFLALAGLALLASAPASALTAKDKMETCKFGADDQKLQGKARNAFMAKCMANEKGAARPKAAAKPAG